MNISKDKLNIIFFAIIYLVMTYFFLINVIKQNVTGKIICIGLLVPFVVLFINHNSKYWFGLLIGLCGFTTLRIPVPLVQGFPIYGLFIGIIIILILLESAINRRKWMLDWNIRYRLFFLFMILIIGRILVDPPGSARLGGTGGLSTALPYAIGSISFFVGYLVIIKSQNWKKNITIAICILIIAYFMMHIFSRASQITLGQHILYAKTFNRQFYLIFSLWLAGGISLAYLKPNVFKSRSIILLILAVASVVRSAPFQAFAMIVMAGYLYNKLQRTLIFNIIISILGISLLLTTIPFDNLPAPIQRTVSVLVPAREFDEGDMGLKSKFREDLIQVAWAEIKSDPLFGKGWSFSLEEILDAVSINIFRDARTAKLAMTGSYHNSLLTIAAKNGIFSTLIFIVAISMSFHNACQWVKQLPDKNIHKKRMSGLLIYATCLTIMMLVNGSGYEFTMLALTFGFISGYIDRLKFLNNEIY